MCDYGKKDEKCAVIKFVQDLIGGKWKMLILWLLKDGKKRFGELKKELGDITQSTLTKQLRALESSGFINRKVYQEVPPKVEYSLTPLGVSSISILEVIKVWAEKNLIE